MVTVKVIARPLSLSAVFDGPCCVLCAGGGSISVRGSVRPTARPAAVRDQHLRRHAADLGGYAFPRGVHAHTGRPHIRGNHGAFLAVSYYTTARYGIRHGKRYGKTVQHVGKREKELAIVVTT